MKKFLVLVFIFFMAIGQFAISASYKVNSYKGNPPVNTLDSCDPPPYSTTVSPYAKQGNCINQQQYNQQNPVQQGLYYNQNNQFSGQANTLAELPLGAIVIDPKSVWYFRDGANYTGEITAQHPVFWQKLEDNHYAQGATTLLSFTGVAAYPFCHSQKGLRSWDESDLRRFLRTTFYNHLSDGFKNSIVNVSIPYADMYGNPKTIIDNFFILSIVEWGLSDRLNNGTAIKYYDLPNIYAALSILSYNKNYGFFNMNPDNYLNWTRTINRPKAGGTDYNKDVFTIFRGGTIHTTEFDRPQIVRPAVNIKSSSKVSGPYNFSYNSNQEFLTYYILNF